MDSLIFDLPIGLRSGGDVLKEVELLRTNGVAEKVFVTKIPERPYTWQGNVLAVAIKRIGNIEIGAEARRSYVKDNAVTIPEAVAKFHPPSGGYLQVLREASSRGY